MLRAQEEISRNKAAGLPAVTMVNGQEISEAQVKQSFKRFEEYKNRRTGDRTAFRPTARQNTGNQTTPESLMLTPSVSLGSTIFDEHN